MAENLIGRTLNNRYQIIERVGVGGMAEVYRAQDNVLGRTVAVKVMLPQYAEDEQFTARFRQEAASAANLSSPYIVNVYDWGQDSGTYYIVMEYVRGSDLKTAIKQRGAINQRKVAEIGSQVCQALSVAHNMDIIHRDIKPQNIMVQPDGNVKVMDFGIARAKNSNADKTGAVLGTAHYISPEQAQGKELTSASDIYSLGIVMYESVTGQLPFDGPDAVSVAMKQVQEMPVPPSQINPSIEPSLEAIIMRAIEKDPANRFATAQEMRSALNDYLAGRPVAFGDFNGARTAVIGVPDVPPISPAYDAEKTSVMPSVDQQYGQSGHGNGCGVDHGNGHASKSYREDATASKKGGKKGAAVAIAAVAVIAVIAVVAFALLSRGSGDITVPNVVGKTQAEATAAITSAGLQVGNITEAYDEKVEAGKVISQDPKGETKANDGAKVNLVISQGGEQVTVPDLENMTAKEARAALQKLGLKDASGTAEYSDSIDKNHVARQEPAAGSKVSKGATITYYLSAGKEGKDVPDVKGKSEGDAMAILQNAGFKVTTQYESSSTVDQGKVISQTPEAGSSQKEGDTINLTVSTGKSTHSVSASAGAGGSVSPSSLTVDDGGSASFTVTPSAGYTVSSVYDNYGDRYNVGASGGTFSISNVTADTSITVEFTKTSSSSGASGAASH